MLQLYNLLSSIALILYFPKLLFKKGPDNKRVFLRERTGRSEYDKTDFWVHAVSVGEILACLPFLKKLKKEFPAKRITLSTTTYTGQKLARERFAEADRVMYMPFDSPLSVKRAVKSLKPELFITAETELWPALFDALKKGGSRIVILNGRISLKSYSGYRKIRFIMKNVLANVDFFYMQSKDDAKRIIEIGADKHRVGVMGNFKFDIEISDSTQLCWQEMLKGDIILAASTHKGEEEILLDAYSMIAAALQNIQLKKNSKEQNASPSDITLILVPRHPERFNEVASLIEKRGFPFIRRSQLNSLSNSESLPSVILVDSIGELSKLFSSASIAFIGGSLVPVGGHNILEPAYWSKPVLFGPYMDNFPIAGKFLQDAAAVETKNAQEIAENVIELINDKGRAAVMGHKAKSIVNKNTGAVNKAIELVRGYVGSA